MYIFVIDLDIIKKQLTFINIKCYLNVDSVIELLMRTVLKLIKMVVVKKEIRKFRINLGISCLMLIKNQELSHVKFI